MSVAQQPWHGNLLHGILGYDGRRHRLQRVEECTAERRERFTPFTPSSGSWLQGAGPSLALVIMVALGYVEADKGNQAFEVALNLRYLVAALYLVSAILQFIGLALIYNLDKKTLERMESELRERREEAAENAEV